MQSVTLSTSASQPLSISPDDVADRIAAIQDTYARDATSAGVCVADGFGVRVTIERGALVVADGIGEHRRTRRFDKATHGLSRIVVVSSSEGFVTFEALRWCQRLGIAVLALGADGSPSLASVSRTSDDARLRRAQALAPSEPYGLDVARRLLGRKLDGQVKLLARRFGELSEAESVAALREAMEHAGTIDELRRLEATAAALYFGAWSGRSECVPRFATKDARRIPAHWRRFETRRSLLASARSNRKAERPTNAILNYCFALLEAEAVLACQAVGLDPGFGIVHLDAKGRDSLALDLIEPVRPEVEGYVLDLLASRTFRKAELTETDEGHVRLRPPLTHELAESLPRWREAIAPLAEEVAHTLGAVIAGRFLLATPLTSSRSKAAQAVVKARKAEASRRRQRTAPARQQPSGPVSLPLGCVECGAALTNPRHVRCDACIAADPAQAPEIRGRRGAAIAARKRAFAEWDKANPGTAYDPELFRREILPRLVGVKLSAIVEAAGCSKAYASDIRRGKWTPHVSTWRALAKLVRADVV
jgi:CRISPR-associated endonuclease Cas1